MKKNKSLSIMERSLLLRPHNLVSFDYRPSLLFLFFKKYPLLVFASVRTIQDVCAELVWLSFSPGLIQQLLLFFQSTSGNSTLNNIQERERVLRYKRGFLLLHHNNNNNTDLHQYLVALLELF